MVQYLKSHMALGAALALVLALWPSGAPPKAQGSGDPPAGVLRCDVDGGIGFIFGSTRSLDLPL